MSAHLVLRPGRGAECEVLSVADRRPAPVVRRAAALVPLLLRSQLVVLDVGGVQRARPALGPERIQRRFHPLAPLLEGLVHLTARLQGHHHWAWGWRDWGVGGGVLILVK